METKYVCTRIVCANDETITTDSLWIVDGRMVIHTMTVENSSQDVLEETVTNPDVDPIQLVYDPNKAVYV